MLETQIDRSMVAAIGIGNEAIKTTLARHFTAFLQNWTPRDARPAPWPEAGMST